MTIGTALKNAQAGDVFKFDRWTLTVVDMDDQEGKSLNVFFKFEDFIVDRYLPPMIFIVDGWEEQ